MQSILMIISFVVALSAGRASAAEDPLSHIRNELDAGKKTVVVPPGLYKLTTEDSVYLKLKDLSGVTIDFTNVEFLGLVNTGMLKIENCTDLTLKGLTIDYDPLPFTQARIVEIDQDKNWKIKIIKGYPTEGITSGDRRIQVFGQNTLELVNPLRFRDGIAIERLARDTYRLSGGKNRTGELGDIVVFNCRNTEKGQRDTISSYDCKNLHIENFTLYSSPGGIGFSEYGNTKSVYLNCKMDRRQPESDHIVRGLKRLRSLTADAFHCKDDPVGPQIIGCVARYQGDDCINISGMYNIVVKSTGTELRILSTRGGEWLAAGDSIQIMTYDGQCPPDAKMLLIEKDGQRSEEEEAFLKSLSLWPGLCNAFRSAFKVKVDRKLDLPRGSVIISKQRSGNGFLIKDCNFGHIRSRGLLIKASEGIIENNTIVNCWGSGMQISPEYQWMEGGCSSELKIIDNRLSGNRAYAIAISGVSGAGSLLMANSHRNILIKGNTISGTANGIYVSGCTGLKISENTLNVSVKKTEDAILLENVAEVARENNTVNMVR